MSELKNKLNQIKLEKTNKIIPGNIKSGTQIFDIVGTYEGTNVSDATATANDILTGKTAYIASGKTNGAMTNNGVLNYTPTTSSQSIPAGYTSGGTIGAVTSAIDNNITAENIKKDVSILGVTGTYEGAGSINILNGILEQYKASTGTISANTFVEFVNGTQLSTETSAHEYPTAVLIDTNTVFITHRGGSYLYGIVCTINGKTITAGTDTQLSTTTNSYYYATAVLIDTNTVFVAHRNNSYLYAMVCTINGTTITAGTDTQLSTTNNSYYYPSAVLIDTNKVFVAHKAGSYLYGVVCTINGTTITHGNDSMFSSTTSSTSVPTSAALIDTNKVFVAYGNSSYLYGIVCTINGTTITTGTNTQLSTASSSGYYPSAVLIDTNKVFVAHGGTDYNINYVSGLYGVVCTINGTTITVGTDTPLTTENNTQSYATAVLIDTNKVFVAHGKGSNLYGVVCTINGTTITTGADIQLSTATSTAQYNSAILINANIIFIAHNYAGLFGKLFKINGTAIIPVGDIIEATSKIEGLLVTEATTSTAGDVWVLNS